MLQKNPLKQTEILKKCTYDMFYALLYTMKNMNAEWGGRVCLYESFISESTSRISMRFGIVGSALNLYKLILGRIYQI